MLQDALTNNKGQYTTRNMGSFETWATLVAGSVKYCIEVMKTKGLVPVETDGDVTPDMTTYSANNDGTAQTFHDIYQEKGSVPWRFQDLGACLRSVDSLLGTDGAGQGSDTARGKRMVRYAEKPRTYENKVYRLEKLSHRKWRILCKEGSGPSVDSRYNWVDEQAASDAADFDPEPKRVF